MDLQDAMELEEAAAEPAAEPVEDAAPEAADDSAAAEPEDPEDLGELMQQELARAGAAQAPDHWSATDKAILARIPDEATRAAVLDWRKGIEKGAQEKFEAAAAVRKEVEEIDQIFAPIAVNMRAQGVNRAAAIRSMLGAFQQIQQDPASAMLSLAEGYRRLNPGGGQAEEVVRKVAAALGVHAGAVATRGQAADPVAQRMAVLEARLAEQDRAQQAAHQQQVHQAVTAADRAIQDFAAAKDQAGNAKHPHFDKVKRTVGALLQAATASGEELTLEQAYHKAVWAQEDLRADLQRAEQAKAARAAAEAQRAAVAKAKGARTPKTRSVPVAPTNDSDDLEALLTATYREIAA